MSSLSKNIIKQALDLSPVATLIVDLKSEPQSVMYANQAFEALSGYDAGELIGRPWSRLAGSGAGIESGQRSVQFCCDSRHGAAEELEFELYPLYDGPGAARYWVATEKQEQAQDDEVDPESESMLSFLREARARMRRADGRDQTTGVLNRRSFEDLMRRDWILARREQRPLALIVFQVDCFTAYCDVFGRHAADAALRKVANLITGSLRRAGDLTARYSDDRFVVLFGQSDSQQALDRAAGIRDKVRDLAIHHPRSLRDRFMTVSYGVASATPDAMQNKPDLIAQADADLQQTRGVGPAEQSVG